jgi:tRNA nucleotidyltransferase/poly(A) polymerase
MTDFTSAIPALFQAIPALAVVSRTPETYLVGGAVRDMLMGSAPLDYDIVVPEDPQTLADTISRDTGAFFFKLGKDRQTVFRGRLKDHTIDLVRMAGGSIESDLHLRDFTVNAMAVHLGSCTFLDPMQGQKDLASRTIRMVSEQAFLSDPLRMLRAYRFAATLNFEIEKKTESAIKTHSRLIRRPAGERIREELLRLLDAPGAAAYLNKMKGSGLLFDLFPELMDERACMQNHHHCFDVLDHTLSACRHLDSFLNGSGMATAPALRMAIDGIDRRSKPILKLAMLLHDIGKPRTRSVDAAGAVHFWGHEKFGAGMAEAITGRLKFSTPDADSLRELIENHLRPVLLYQAHRNQSLTRKGIVRLFRSLNDHTPDLLIMALADACAKTETPRVVDPSFAGFIADLIKTYFRDYLPRKNNAPLITGQDLITLFGMQPSPMFKTILTAVEEARLSQTLAGRQDAIAMVHTWLSSNDKRYSGTGARNRKKD